jgi:hypothetical protein
MDANVVGPVFALLKLAVLVVAFVAILKKCENVAGEY